MARPGEVFHADIDKARQGFAGMHDLIEVKNINRTLKQNEVLSQYQSIYLPPPAHFTPGAHRVLLV